MNSLLNTDGYKCGHKFQYPQNTQYVYSTWTPRKSRIPGITHVVHFGLQHFIMKWLVEDFRFNFFDLDKKTAVAAYKRILDNYLGKDSVDVTHIEELHDLGYLPLRIKSLPEGSRVPMRCPAVTIVNTAEKFYWLTNYIETLMSAELWGPTTSATIAREYKKILRFWCKTTGGDLNFIQFQGHDFSMRGMYGIEAAKLSGMGHLTSFTGTDTIPAIVELERYYGANSDIELVGASVPATEHAVMCAGGKADEVETFRRLIQDVYPSGVVSIVSDTWDLWKVCTNYLPQLKDIILSRDGKVVIRPDSGDPVDILCGTMSYSDVVKPNTPQEKGVVELLWDIFGGSVNEKGYKVLDPRIGAIYGDSITLERCKNICSRLEEKGFASTNVVFGIGSYTYQYNTRDTFGFAMKATWCKVDGVGHSIFKDPVTDDGTKRSNKGLIQVNLKNGEYECIDECTSLEEQSGCLQLVFENGLIFNKTSLREVRQRIEASLD